MNKFRSRVAPLENSAQRIRRRASLYIGLQLLAMGWGLWIVWLSWQMAANLSGLPLWVCALALIALTGQLTIQNRRLALLPANAQHVVIWLIWGATAAYNMMQDSSWVLAAFLLGPPLVFYVSRTLFRFRVKAMLRNTR